MTVLCTLKNITCSNLFIINKLAKVHTFFMDLKNIHIGKDIKKKLIEKSITITEFARSIDRERTTVYDIFRRKSIDTELLIKISEALNYDFHQVYFPDKPQKAQIIIEVDRKEIDKLDLSKGYLLPCIK